MKKIMFVGDAESIHIAKYVNYYANKSDYDVCIATFSQTNCTDCKNVNFLSKYMVTTGGGNYHYLFSIFKLALLIRKYNPDYINAHFSYSMGFIALLAMILSGINAKFSVVCHGSDIMAYPHKWCFWLNKIVLNAAERIIAVSEPMYKKLLSWKINPQKIFVGQYGVLIEKKESVKRDIDIISIRDASPNSQIEFMLCALSKIENIRYKKIVFVIPNIDRKRLETLKEKYSYIKFYERMSHSDIVSLLVRTKIYISATKSDGTSLSLLEAMAYGAYPIVSNIPTNACWIQNDVNGKLFQTESEFICDVNKTINLSASEYKSVRKSNYSLVDCKCNYYKQMKKIEYFLFK